MTYTVFDRNKNDQLKEPMFFGQGVNVSRYDQQKHTIFEKLTEKQLGFFWLPNEIDVTKDRIDYNNLHEHEKHIFISNLKYQTLLDSIQGRSPNVAFLPIVSLPELETWIESWSFSETIHSRSYTHIIRNIVNDPSIVFDDVVENEHILKRAKDIAHYYDDLILACKEHEINGKYTKRELKKKLYMCMMSVNVLEAVRFYVSFACSFAFAERNVMEGNAKIIRLIARDEALHQSGTQHMLKMWANGVDDMEMSSIAAECEAESIELFRLAAEQEKEWGEYLFKDGGMIGLNQTIINEYIEYRTGYCMKYVGLPSIFPDATNNPIPWINNWLSSDNVQVAPQETEIPSYLTASVASDLDDDDLGDLAL